MAEVWNKEGINHRVRHGHDNVYSSERGSNRWGERQSKRARGMGIKGLRGTLGSMSRVARHK